MVIKTMTVLFCFFLPQHLIAGWLIDGTFSGPDPKTPKNVVISPATHYVDGAKVRVDMANPTGKVRMLMVNNETIMCQENTKSCTKQKFTGHNSVMSQMSALDETIKMTKYSVKPTGQSKTVAGKSCKVAVVEMVFQSQLMPNSVHTNKNCYFEMDANYRNQCLAVMKQTIANSKWQAFEATFRTECNLGYPVETTTLAAETGKYSTVYVAKKITSKTLPASTFSTPSGYKISSEAFIPVDIEKMKKLMNPKNQKRAH